MQASLSDYPPSDPPEAVYNYQALNHVGVAYWVKGEILMEEGQNSEAREAFNTVVNEFGYAQYQNPEGVFLKASELANARLAELQVDMN